MPTTRPTSRPAARRRGATPVVRTVVRLDPRVPAQHRTAIVGTVASARQIRDRVRQLAVRIQADLGRREWVVVALLNGSVLFVADLIRELPGPLRLDFIGVSSYGDGTESGRLVYTKELKIDVKGRPVLVVDDILDSGRTLDAVVRKLRQLGASRVKTCVLLDKPSRRKVPLNADYIGFRIPDWFVVGYGLDFAERFRNLPFIGVLGAEEIARAPRERAG